MTQKDPNRSAAEEAEHSERWTAAADAWQRVLQADPDDLESLQRYAEAVEHADAPMRALDAWQTFSKKSPESSSAQLGQIRALLAVGRPHEALRMLEPLLNNDPLDADLLVVRARGLAAAGNYAKAAAAWSAVPTDSPARLAASGLFHAERQRDYRGAETDDGLLWPEPPLLPRWPWPDDAVAWVEWGRALGREDRLEDAGAANERALDIAPGWVEAARALALVHERRQDWAGALAGWEAVLERAPGDTEAMAGAAEAHRLLGDFDQATDLFDRLLGTWNQDAFAARGRAIVALSRGNVDIARGWFDRALELDPGCRHASDGLAACDDPAVDNGWDRPQSTAQRDRVRGWLDAGRRAAAEGDLDHARRVLQRATTTRADLVDGWVLLGHVCMHLRDATEALTAYDLAIRHDPARLEAGRMAGSCHASAR